MRRTGQASSEYLLLLGAAIIVGLVVVVFLMSYSSLGASTELTKSRAYWTSASPIIVTEEVGRLLGVGGSPKPYFRIKNIGNNPVRITKILGGGRVATRVNTPSGLRPLRDVYYLAPNEENYIMYTPIFDAGEDYRYIWVHTPSTCWGDTNELCGASSVCTSQPMSNGHYGTLVIPKFGFEYVEIVKNQEITKTEIGSVPLSVECLEPYT